MAALRAIQLAVFTIVIGIAAASTAPIAIGQEAGWTVLFDGKNLDHWDQLTVVLNGQTTAKLRSGMFDEGPIVLQHGAGTIKFRKVEVKPL